MFKNYLPPPAARSDEYFFNAINLHARKRQCLSDKYKGIYQLRELPAQRAA